MPSKGVETPMRCQMPAIQNYFFDSTKSIFLGCSPFKISSLNSNLNVPCACARKVISGPKAYNFPFPTGASNATTPPFKYDGPQAHPLRKGFSSSNQANGFTFPCIMASGATLNTGL